MVEADRRVRVEVDDDSLVVTASRVRAAIADERGLVVTVGGDCGVELEPVAAARKRYGDRLVVVWFDAHADLNTPKSSPSGAYHGMVLRALTGEGPEGLVPDTPLDSGRIVLAGVRDLDPAEVDFVAAMGIPLVDAEAGGDAAAVALVEAIEGAVASPSAGPGDAVVYVHVDFDVLDPEVFRSVGSPAPGGLHPERLLSLVNAIARRFEVVGLGLMEYEPARHEDRELLSGLVGGLVNACAGRRTQPGRTAPR
ncbi:arginase family protein [Nonomuraea turcica]|uniref:arginase family protein n=1 Tax=Nonomuraea sp. G32 TaxID=3067274 RepID=UPI00273C61C6|nr:arginase family protein [Nonomuraea sp. G32]MDP4507482.1 arginase family protein [Nonomuraea sp. G32]